MNQIAPRVLLFVLLVTVAGSVGSAPVAALRSQVQAVIVEERIPGMSIAVARDGKLLWSEGFGYANLEQKVLATARTKFRIASISKAMTATCAMRLHESGKLDLDAPLHRYLPDYPEHGRAITVRQLASHRSGIDHYREEDLINTMHYADMTAALTKFQGRSLLAPPGARYRYSSFGYNLIGAVVEKVTGVPFTVAMRDCLMDPLQLRETVPDDYRNIVAQRTAFYVLDEQNQVHNAPAVDNSDLWPAGGYLSTAEDVVRFADAVVNGHFLKPQTRESMLMPARENQAEGQPYGLGWGTRESQGETVVGHTGSHFGATSRLSVYRKSRLVVAVLTNVSPEGDSRLKQQLMELSDRIAGQFRKSTRQ